MKQSGKFVLRISPEMHTALKKEAEEKNISLNQIINSKLLQNQTHQFECISKLFKSDLIGIVLFGSYVRGDQRKSSDIDLLIVLSDKVKVERKLYSIWDEKIEPILGSLYSPQFSHIPNSIESISSLWLEVGLEGEIIYDPTSQLKKHIYKIKNEISSGKYQRKITHGHPYWIKKENI